MKNLLALAIVLSSVSAFATRARVTALGNSPHLIDVALSSPDQVFGLGDSLTVESGATTTTLTALPATTPTRLSTNTANAEGTLYKSMGAGKLGLALGHQDTLVNTMRRSAVTAIPAIKAQQNPLEVSYSMNIADLVGSAGIIYSNYDKKSPAPTEKESTMGVRLGVSNSMFYGNVKLLVADKYETPTVEYKGKMGIDLKGGMNFGETLSAHANIVSFGYKTSAAGTDTSDVEGMLISVKLVDAVKKDGNNFFYGVGLSTVSTKQKIGAENKGSTLNLPLIIGLEATANSWLTLRASVQQDVLLSNEKTEVAGTASSETNPGLNTTTYAAGASFAFNKISIDGTLTNGAGNQTINGTDLLGMVGLTYNF